MQTVRPQLAGPALGESQRREHARGLGLVVAQEDIRLLRRAGRRLAYHGKINTGTHALDLGGHDDDAREPGRRVGSEQFGKEEFREEERADVVDSHLAFDVVDGDGVDKAGVGRIVDQHLCGLK